MPKTLVDWVIAIWLVCVLCLFAHDSYAHDGGWFKSETREPAPKGYEAQVFEVDNLPEACYLGVKTYGMEIATVYGCYYPWRQDTVFPFFITPGMIFIVKRLSPWKRECVLIHERKHDEGLDHGPRFYEC